MHAQVLNSTLFYEKIYLLKKTWINKVVEHNGFKDITEE